VAPLDPLRRVSDAAVARLPPSGQARAAAAFQRRAYRRAFGFAAPPPWTALMSHWHVLEEIERHGLADGRGDLVEIGVFLGGGTYQLARLLERRAPHRRVVAVDVFDPAWDGTPADGGPRMAEIYRANLRGRDQLDAYRDVLAGCANVVTVVGDSARVDLPTRAIAFAHVDGSHEPAHVRADFALVWERLVPGGIVALDDYGADLPGVTAAIDRVRADHAEAIDAFWVGGPKTAFVRKVGAR
jgi:predicted methyltransferase